MTQWNEILTDVAGYHIKGATGCLRVVGEDVVFDTTSADPTEFEFFENWRGQMYIREKGTNKHLYYDAGSSKWVVMEGTGTQVVPDDHVGGILFRIVGDKYMAKGDTGAPTFCVVTTANPAAEEAQWVLEDATAPEPDTPLERWLHTYIPENRFSAGAFLEHVRRVVTASDEGVHDSAEYLQGLSVPNDPSPIPVSTAILVKIDAWKQDFPALTSLQRAEANGAMLLASAHFYNHPTSPFNELDTDRPPEWPGVDDELGGDPYPG